MKLLSVLLVFLFALTANAQSAAVPATKAESAVVRFSLDWNRGIPWTSYAISVESGGKAHFDGVPSAEQPAAADRFQQDFVMSAANLQKIFELTHRLNNFDGDFESRKHGIAATGEKNLQYTSGQTQHSTTFNWSQNQDLEELTRLFQGMATTMAIGCKLNYQYRFDKLGMDEQLKDLQDLQQKHAVEEVGALEPILRRIASDSALMHISRQTAQKLLQGAGSAPQAAGDSPTQP
jgi:hypothetical protein